MNFGAWVSLNDVPVSAPDRPGMLQARADALRTYPEGKSAMVLYARCRPDETLRRYVHGRGAPGLDRAVDRGARLVRFGVSDQPELEFNRLMRRFVDRFGARPAANVADDADDRNDDDGKERRLRND